MKSCCSVRVSVRWAGCVVGLLLLGVGQIQAGDYVPFAGEKSAWHEGFDRFDYQMDEGSLELKPFKRAANEVTGVPDPPAGKRRCIVVVPKQVAEGRPWSWQACYWNHEPQAEVELLRRGYHVVYISANATLKPDKTWEAWYAHLTAQHGLAAKPAFVGMSRGGEYAYTWGARHPDKVSCIYGDNPAINAEGLSQLGALAKEDVPLLHVCGSIDPLLGPHSNTIETIYRQLGGRISVIVKEGAGHHPHSLRDPQVIADFITQSFVHPDHKPPAFTGEKVKRTSFYGRSESYAESEKEGTYLTYRGPQFTDSYERYSFDLNGVEAPVQVILPKTPAAGSPWVFRADVVTADSAVDLALLSQGFAIVTGPVPYNANGPHLQHWNKVYEHLTNHGFSKRPVLTGTGGAAGEAYAWAIANPGKVACIYAESPRLHSTMTKSQPLEGLEVLAKAHIPILHTSGSQDPLLISQTRVAEKKYRELGGDLTVLVSEGAHHYPTTPQDVPAVVKFLVQHASKTSATPGQ